MGVAGSGKSTVGKLLAKKMQWQFLEGDDFHSSNNIKKMKAGIPLTDEDRIPWLQSIKNNMAPRTIVACSALKESYQKLLMDTNISNNHFRNTNDNTLLVYLKCSPKLITKRLKQRKHFFNPSLLESQFADLEEPAKSEQVLIVDASLSPEEIVEKIMLDLNSYGYSLTDL